MIGQLYEDGTATLDILGLQCVGYNNDLNRALQDELSNLQAERDMPGRAPSAPVRLHRVTRSSVLEISGGVPPGVGKRPRGDSDAAEVSRRQKASRR
ncbi:uncharacterized protein LAESUDRAFT_728681 [Laetiporus sulphureus 93-53]|uniref:Uncharacterized protein n=1 Tax=Laetiporus sulphureus 93-53 TaxID=1314785 RepID=A0A165D1M4_9APHY|nr:uncharacterized protein LAESUDRAFT_728681 [Laetiporus sulphureus 93-53]KZT03968.1 hypothetical protein LAESUDRAFT_728681 [Laetiporus sulphureus 93-53]